MRYANVVTFEVRGDYALFSDPITRVGGEKISYQIPTYEAIKGVVDSVYWKPTIIWVIDEVRIMNQIRTEAKAIRTLSYTKNTPDLSYYTYLKDVVYQVKAHFEWNLNRPELENDRNEDKHYQMALRMIKKGGRRDVFLGTRECQAYVTPISFGEGEGFYDNSGTLSFGFMYHGIVYPDESSEKKGMIINFWNSRMVDGVIKYTRPSECEFKKVVNSKSYKKFEEGINFSILNEDKGGRLMGLLAQAAKTYDLMMDEIGVIKGNNAYFPLVPLYHIKKKIDFIVLLKEDGTLVNIVRTEENGIIPATEAAQGRSGTTVAPYPLIDQGKYFVDEKKVDAYLDNLKIWCEKDPDNIVIKAVYSYVSKRIFQSDLAKAGITEDYLGKNVGWEIITSGKNIKTWDNHELQESFTSFFKEEYGNGGNSFCMISGKEELPIKIVPSISKFGLAKLISSNDTSDFSFRGRFVKSEDAVSLGYDTTQKAINALSWLCGNQSVYLGRSSLLCWNPDGVETGNPTLPLIGDEKNVTYSDYKNALNEYVKVKTNNLELNDRNVITVIFDTPTTGRLSIKFYNELTIDDFISNLASWDSSCCWYDSREGKVRSPRLSDIMKYSFGSGESFRIDNKVYEMNYPILVERRVSNGRIPTEIVRNLVNKSSNLQIYMKNNYWDAQLLQFVTCCVLRKYLIDSIKEEYNMALERDLKNRSYQYGRLLAVLEKIELDALSGTDTKRVTNAIRMQSMFIRRPGYTSKLILEKLKYGYYSRFTGAKAGALFYYEKLIGEIMNVISSFSLDEFDKPLDETYIMGYYLQKNDFYSSKNDDNKED